MRNLALFIACSFLAIVLTGNSSSNEDPSAASLPVYSEEELMAGGSTTVFDESKSAFGFPATNLPSNRRSSFFVGNSFFNQNWVQAPASTEARDGLGPLFNTRSCSGCHFKDGRSQPPQKDKPFSTVLLRVSRPNPEGKLEPDPVYGDQIQGLSLPGTKPEADVFVDYEPVEGSYADGQKYELRHPSYRLENLNYGPVSSDLLMSARVAPPVFGSGLLEAVPESTIQEMADPDDEDQDGISGTTNKVPNVRSNKTELGRFGWKAEQPSLRQQIAGAFRGDMGLTTSLMPLENHTDTEKTDLPSGGDPEVSDEIFDDIVFYIQTLAVPASRNLSEPIARRGKQLFTEIGCVSCHRPELKTGASFEIPELCNQTIHPYTDLLLHDMGPDLADNRPVFLASGSEWRTPPLWGLGLVQKVNGHSTLLHDGRARNFPEAILWHGGEAEPARDRFKELSQADREALVVFLQSL